jgi:hypothetical protein
MNINEFAQMSRCQPVSQVSPPPKNNLGQAGLVLPALA